MPYHSVIELPPYPDVLDLSSHEGISQPRTSPFSIGRYNEKRIVYTHALFGGERTIHMGIDLGGPVGTPVHAFSDGRIFCLGVNPDEGDYGPTIITVHELNGRKIWALHGHLSAASLQGKILGQSIQRGDIIGWLGSETENGNWPPHVHFQLSWEAPSSHDMPGAVTENDRNTAMSIYPDPQIVLGRLY